MNGNSNDTSRNDDEDQKQSLREFLSHLSAEEKITLKIKRKDYLLSALEEILEKKKRFPVIELVDPDTRQRTVANIFANRDILNRHIENVVDTEIHASEFKDTVTVQNAPVHECISTGDQVDLLELPVFVHFPEDAGRYITSGIVIAKDPETGRYNFSFHRMMLKTQNKIGISLHSRGDLWNYYRKAEEMGCDLEIAVVIGTHPAYYLAGATKIPNSIDDYAWAAAYMNERAKVARCKTVDLEIPAYAEYVLEGVISREKHEDEGPFGEYTGYSTSRSTRNVFLVSCVTKRADAIYQDLVPGYAWEHLLLSQYTKEIILLDKLKKEIPEVKALSMPKNGCHFHAYVSMKPKAEGQARQVMMLLFGLDIYLKLIVVVDEDIDVYNEEEVMWAVATRMQADQQVFVIPKVICNRLDPSSKEGMSAKMGIDATKKNDWDAEKIKLPQTILEDAEKIIKEIGKKD